MTAALLDRPALAGLAGVPNDRLRHYAETGLLPPARRDGEQLGYPPATAHTVRLLAGAENLGIGSDSLAVIVGAWLSGRCDEAHRQLCAAVRVRLVTVQRELTGRLELAAALAPDRTRTVVTYCSGPSCGRSTVAAAAFTRLGYTEVHVYEGGRADWADAGLAFHGTRGTPEAA